MLSLILARNIKQDGSLTAAFRNVLVFALLGGSQGVILIKQTAQVDAVGFSVTGANDSNPSTSDIPEAHMESTELGANHQEHSKGPLRVFGGGEEGGVEAEAEGYLVGLVKVGFEYVAIECEHTLKDHQFVLVANRLFDSLPQFFISQHFILLNSLIRKGRSSI